MVVWWTRKAQKNCALHVTCVLRAASISLRCARTATNDWSGVNLTSHLRHIGIFGSDQGQAEAAVPRTLNAGTQYQLTC